MNGKDIANMIHNLKQISRSDVSGMMREQLRNSIIDECAQFVERKLEGCAIVKIVDCNVCHNTGSYSDPHWTDSYCSCTKNPASRFNNQESK